MPALKASFGLLPRQRGCPSPLALNQVAFATDPLRRLATPRAAAGFLVHAAGLTREQLGARINITMPGVSCTVAEQIDALKRIAGDKVAGRIRREPDELIMRIVNNWPQRFDARRAAALGFKAETSFDDIVRTHIDDELGGRIAA